MYGIYRIYNICECEEFHILPIFIQLISDMLLY